MGNIFGSHSGLGRQHVHGLRPGDAGDEFQGKQRHTPLGELLGCGRAAERIDQPDDNLSGSEAGQIGLARPRVGPGRAELKQHVGGEDLFARADLAPLFGVLLIREAGILTGARLDHNLNACLE